MDYNKLYEQYAPDYDVISTEYIKDDEEGENSYDRKAMIDFLEFVVAENEDDEYYKELADSLKSEPSLRKWWAENYDPKGIAMTMSYHSSILEDVRDMVAEYSKTTEHWKRTEIGDELKSIHRADETSIYFPIKEYNEDTGPYCTPEEVFLDNLLYCYSGAPIKDAEVDEEKKVVILTWDNDILKHYHR